MPHLQVWLHRGKREGGKREGGKREGGKAEGEVMHSRLCCSTILG